MGLDQFDVILAFSGIILALSLLITVLVQMVIAASGLRGHNLQWGLEELFKRLDPAMKLEGMAKNLAKAVTEHPAIKDTWIGKASVIRPQELLLVLEDISRSGSGGLDEGQKAALAAAIAQTVPGSTPSDAARANAVIAELTQIFPASSQAVRNAVARAMDNKKHIELEIDAWFGTVMDRVTDAFARHTAIITAVIATVLCLSLHIDSLAILKQLSANPVLSARLAQGSESLLKEAEATLQKAAPVPLATLAIQSMKDQVPETSKTLIDKVDAKLESLVDGRRWIETNLPAGDRAVALARYEESFSEETRKRMGGLSAEYDRLRKSLDATGLQIVPESPPAYSSNARHLLGVLMSILFLSLGAPFWYNVLKQLSTLRPIVAGKIEREEAAG